MIQLNPILKRLLPLYVCSFFDGLVFWYAIEKLFMVGIGFTPGTIGIFAVVLAAVGLILEIPAGILADRWSRKGILMIASACLAMASLLLGLSDSVWQYVLATCLYGVYFSFHSGTNEAMVYDVLLEEKDSRDGYEKYYGYTTLIGGAGLVIGSLAGGVIASKLNLQSAYFLTIPNGLLAMLALWFFVEPTLHKSEETTQIVRHTTDTLRAVFRKGHTVWVLIALLSSVVLFELMTELDQLWPLALNLRVELYGPLNALVLAGFGIGGVIAGLLVRKQFLLPVAYGIALLVIYLLTVRNMAIVAAAQFGVVALYAAFYTIALGKLQDSLPSKLRSGAASVTGTLGGLIYIPVVIVFGVITDHRSVFSAALLLVPLAILSVISMIIVMRHNPRPRIAELPTPLKP